MKSRQQYYKLPVCENRQNRKSLATPILCPAKQRAATQINAHMPPMPPVCVHALYGRMRAVQKVGCILFFAVAFILQYFIHILLEIHFSTLRFNCSLYICVQQMRSLSFLGLLVIAQALIAQILNTCFQYTTCLIFVNLN